MIRIIIDQAHRPHPVVVLVACAAGGDNGASLLKDNDITWSGILGTLVQVFLAAAAAHTAVSSSPSSESAKKKRVGN